MDFSTSETGKCMVVLKLKVINVICIVRLRKSMIELYNGDLIHILCSIKILCDKRTVHSL